MYAQNQNKPSKIVLSTTVTIANDYHVFTDFCVVEFQKNVQQRSTSGPKHQHEIFSAVDAMLVAYAERHNLREAAETFFQNLQRDVLQHRSGIDDALSDVARLAQRIWSSGQKLQGVPLSHELEFCSILNSSIRSNDPALLEPALPIILAINSLCVVRGIRQESLLRFPPEHRVYRGTGIPVVHDLAWFTAGRKFRVPAFFASSFKKQVGPRHARCSDGIRPPS